MKMPDPTPVYRIVHIDNLPTLLERGGLHAPNHQPDDGLPYRAIHDLEIQVKRRQRRIPCGPGGVIHDYVSFYFGPRSPMLFQLHTGRVSGYTEGQDPIIYLVSTAQRISASGLPLVFSNGHGIAAFTSWFDDLGRLDEVDWSAAYSTIWKDTLDDMDRQRRKQSEFLVHRFCPWELVDSIGVRTRQTKERVEAILADSLATAQPPVIVRTDWYY